MIQNLKAKETWLTRGGGVPDLPIQLVAPVDARPRIS
jgi:hypothetical protein